ncbi:hypothetical protein MLD38_027565 [Melastoma candidum]|uniref:Uncharacterized protein n=1 Tax=Melastoma candidum TaxID=119954 RepID=A0ACB9P256_9MYRT|nr:hypothetical protein MLD38_027565 [Melastoma candidum]
MALENLIDILTWEKRGARKCRCTYILVILAHQGTVQRAKMVVKSGIIHVLLSCYSGSRTREGQVSGPHSGPQAGFREGGMSWGRWLVVNRGEEMREGRMMMEELVKESLRRNMEVITRRANNSTRAPRGEKIFRATHIILV